MHLLRLTHSLKRPVPGTSFTVYQETLHLVQDLEAAMVRMSLSSVRPYAYIQRILWMPTLFIRRGLDTKLASLTSWTFASIVFMSVGAWITRPEVQAPDFYREGIAWVCLFVPAFLALFPMPSVYASAGLSETDVVTATERLKARRLNTKPKLNLVQQTLKVVEGRCTARQTTLKWLLGIAWASWTFLSVKEMDVILAGTPPTIGALLANAIGVCAILLSYLMVSGYGLALNRLFRAAELACGELVMLLESEEAGLKDAGESPPRVRKLAG